MARHCNEFCPLCYANRRGRSAYEHHRFMKRPARSGPAESCVSCAAADVLSQTHPLLFERLTDGSWDDGASRETDTLFLFHDGVRWKCMLKDRAQGLVAFVSSNCLQGLWDALECGLAAGTLDWRRDRQLGGKKK